MVGAPFKIRLSETEQPDLAEDVPAYYREAGLNASPSDSVTLVYISSLLCQESFL